MIVASCAIKLFCKRSNLEGKELAPNPTGLRKAKIVYNFGLSECNRIKGANSFHTILAFLSAIGLKEQILFFQS